MHLKIKKIQFWMLTIFQNTIFSKKLSLHAPLDNVFFVTAFKTETFKRRMRNMQRFQFKSAVYYMYCRCSQAQENEPLTMLQLLNSASISPRIDRPQILIPSKKVRVFYNFKMHPYPDGDSNTSFAPWKACYIHRRCPADSQSLFAQKRKATERASATLEASSPNSSGNLQQVHYAKKENKSVAGPMAPIRTSVLK